MKVSRPVYWTNVDEDAETKRREADSIRNPDLDSMSMILSAEDLDGLESIKSTIIDKLMQEPFNIRVFPGKGLMIDGEESELRRKECGTTSNCSGAFEEPREQPEGQKLIKNSFPC